MSDTTETAVTLPEKSDRLALNLSAGVAGMGIVATLITTITRLVELAPGHDIPVRVPLDDAAVGLPLGPGGSLTEGVVDNATVFVSEPDSLTLFALWAEPLVWGAMWAGLLLIGGMLCLRFARAQAFTRTTSRLLLAAAIIVAAGWGLGSIFSNIAANGALAEVSGGTHEGFSYEFSLAAIIGIVALGAFAIAIQAGERLQRETEGLV